MNRTLALLLFSNAVASVGTGIAMIAVPWLLAQGDDGAVLFSRIATVVNIGLFLVTPFIGPVIDSRPRKQLMIRLRLGFVAGLVGILAAGQIFQSLADSLFLAAYYILGATFYVVNIPLRSAFVKELFEEGTYVQVNAILEIENQVAAVITGLLAILVIDLFGLSSLVLVNVLCLGLAVASLQCIRQDNPPQGHMHAEGRASLYEGIQLLLAKPKLMVLILAASVPYVVVILFTVIHPVALALLPDATGRSYAVVELLFALGAIAGGMAISTPLLQRHQSGRVLEITLWIFGMVAVTQAMFQTLWGFLLLAGFFGFFNAATRILRQTVIMTAYRSHEVGRVSALVQSWIMLLRSIGMAGLSVALMTGLSVSVWLVAVLAMIAPVVVSMGCANSTELAPSNRR